MSRRLFNVLTVASAVLLAAVGALWGRSGGGADTIILRTSPWYVGGPRLKFVTVESYDGLVVSFATRVVPDVVAPAPPWRADVPFSTRAPAAHFYGDVPVWRVMPPLWPGTRPMTDDERGAYEDEVGDAYRGTRPLRGSGGPTSRRVLVGSAPGPLLLVGLRSSGGDEYLTEDSACPGAYRVIRFRAPFALAAAVFGALPLARGAMGLRRRVQRRRRRRVGLCRGCGYDLRGSGDRCPECGRPVPAGSAAEDEVRVVGAAGANDDGPAPAGRSRPSHRPVVALVAVAAAAAAMTWVLIPGAGTGGAAGGPRQDPWTRERARALVESVPTAEVHRGGPRIVWLPEPGVAAGLRAMRGWIDEAYPATIDPATGAIYAPGRGGLTRLDPKRSRRTTIVCDQRLPTPLGAVGLAFDPRRHRLMMVSATAGGTTVYFYSPATEHWTAPATLPKDAPDSLAYSPADDSFYVLSRTRVARSQVYAITRLDAETGQPQWRIPVRERIAAGYDFGIGMGQWRQPQLAAVGPFLAIVTPPTGPGARPEQRFIVINPETGEVVYSEPVP